jgi:ATP/maltotriose-dependent transcriptional regulator MalT
MAQAYEGVALVSLGAVEPGERRLHEAREAAASRGLHLVAQFADLFLADALTNRGALDEAEAFLRECRDQAAQSSLWSAVWSISAARILGARGDGEDSARSLLRAALDVCAALSPGYSAQAAALLGAVELARGERARAAELAHDALRCIDSVGTFCYDVAIRVRCADVLRGVGDHAAAARAVAAALERVEARAVAIDDPVYRGSFLAVVPENVRARALALGHDRPA